MSKRSETLSQERKKRECICLICAWVWLRRIGTDTPKRCPNCKNSGWQIGRRRATREDA